MGLQHNKKRNIGLINEFFARYIAEAIIDHKDQHIKNAKELFFKHFQKNTDLFRELKLFQTLYETKVNSRESAISLINKVKEACKLQSQTKLDLEKTALLHEINAKLNHNEHFFDYKVDDFKTYATIQILLNHWRGGIISENISEIVQLEEKLLEHFINSSKTKIFDPNTLQMTHEDVDGLVVHLMTEKINNKFKTLLNDTQKSILKHYVFAVKDETAKKTLSVMLENTRDNVLNKIDYAIKEDPEIRKLGLKLNEIKELIHKDYSNLTNPDDKTITFYMTLSQLEKELS